jgi:hypothetical protein
MTSADQRSPLAPALGLGFFVLYLGWGLAFHFHSPRLFHYLDQVFDADIPSRIIDLTRVQGPHPRSQYHPLFVLLLNPLGFGLRALVRSGLGVEASGRVAAIALCSAAGGVAAAAFARLLIGSGLAPVRAVLWTLVFGLSASQLVFASLPESWIFSGLTLVLLFAVGTRPAPPRDGLLLAGAAAFGMAVTNLGAAALVRARWLIPERRPAPILVGLARYLFLVLLLTALLATLQAVLYPGTTPFYRPELLNRDDQLSFVNTPTPSAFLERGTEVGAHLLFFDVAAPRLVVTETGTPRTIVDFPEASLGAFRATGAVHAVLWSALLLLSVPGLARTRDPLVVALGLWLASQAALHMVFGTSLFLYSCQWTFAVIALAAVGTNRFGPKRGLDAALLALVTLQAVTNTAFLLEILRLFAEPR